MCVHLPRITEGIHLVKSFALPLKKSIVIPYFIQKPSCLLISRLAYREAFCVI